MDIDALEQRYTQLLPFMASLDYVAEKNLLTDMFAALRQQQEALKESKQRFEDGRAEVEASLHWEYNNAILRAERDNLNADLAMAGVHVIAELQAERDRLREAIEKAHYCLVQAIPHKLRITNTLFELEQVLEPTKGSE